eukprot:53991-Eustigmatos_ZCMA.PRE.1
MACSGVLTSCFCLALGVVHAAFGLEAFLQGSRPHRLCRLTPPADTYALATKAWHYGNNALLVATPLAFFISPSLFVWP